MSSEVKEMMNPYVVPGVMKEDPVTDPLLVLQLCGLMHVDLLNVKTRLRELVVDRQLYMYYLVKLWDYTLDAAASVFERNHATALHAIRLVQDLRQTDNSFLLKMRKIEVKIDNQYSKSMTYKKYFIIEKKIKEMGFDVERKELIELFTNGRTDSLRALKTHEYIEFVDWLGKRFKLNSRVINNWKNDPMNKMRQKIWVLFIVKMGYSEKEYNEWLLKYGIMKKPIMNYRKKELSMLVTQAEKVYESYLEEVKKPSVSSGG